MTDTLECAVPEIDGAAKTSQADPVWSSSGLVRWVNHYRSRGNSSEKPLNGTIPDTLFSNVGAASQQTGVPSSIIMYLLDWDQDLTGNSGGNANGVAHQTIGDINNLRSVLGRDPFYGEILAAHALGGASNVLQIYKLALQQPEKIAQVSGGGSKQDIIAKKLRNNNLVPRTNREVYEFFKFRMITGQSIFTKFLGNTSTIVGALGPNNPITGLLQSQAGLTQSLVSAIGGGSAAGLIGAAASIFSQLSSLSQATSLFQSGQVQSGQGGSSFSTYAASDQESVDGSTM